MAISEFAFDPATGFNDATEFPDPANETAARAQVQSLLDQLKTYVNDEIKDVLNSVVDGASGGDNVAMTAITELGAAATAQAIVEAFVAKTQSTTDSSSGANFIKATAIAGLSGGDVQVLLEALKAYIDTHKSSSDHDSRYYQQSQLYTQVQVNALLLALELGELLDDSITNDKLGTDIKIGSLALLPTTDQSDLVSAIIEILGTGWTTETVKGVNDALALHQADYVHQAGKIYAYKNFGGAL